MPPRGKFRTTYPVQACEPEVAEKINEWIHGIARTHGCRAVHIVEIDGYFGGKWVKFSSKCLGAFGVWRKRTTIPPFVPSRVLYERRLLLKGRWAQYEDNPDRFRLHRYQESTRNYERIASRIAPDVAMIWFGGGSAQEGEASFMAYVPVSDEDHWCWYASLKRMENWRVSRLIGITRRELAYIEAHGKPNVFGPVPKQAGVSG